MKKHLVSRKGATMVELLVTFALLTIFMASAVAVVTPCTKIFLRVKYLSYAQNVGDMVMEKAAGEISSASGSVIVADDGSSIGFFDSSSSPLYIHKTDDDLLNIHYREVRVIEGNVVTTDVLWPAADWGYDKKAYQGYLIADLRFAKSAGNSVEITLELKNPSRDILYTSQKTVECYNLPASDGVKTGTVYLDDKDYYDHFGDS